jgi:3-deoxy-7-phosphoheptulonate synthase
MAATINELLLSAEYVLAEGNEKVILCERGVRGFDDVTRNVLDVGAIAYLKRATHLPVIADPSHAAGRADLVPPLALAGVAAGADGLLIEVHSAPSEARSDADQALGLQRFARLSQEVEALASLDGRRLVRSDERAGGAGTPDLEYA